MSPKIFQTILLLIFSIAVAHTQPPVIQWAKLYGGPENDSVIWMEQTNDGGFIFCGTTNSSSGDVSSNYGSSDLWIVKLDADGMISWQKCLGGISQENARKIRQTTDGGYIVGALTNSFNTGIVGNTKGDFDYWVIKLTSTGDISWQKTFGGTGLDQLMDIQQTTDGGYIIAGQGASTDGDQTGNHGSSDAWLLKLDATGGISWQKSIGGSAPDAAICIKQTPDGGYIFAGNTASTDGDVINPTGVNRIPWIVKLDATAGIQWQKTYGSPAGNEAANQISLTSDGGFIVSASCQANGGDVTGNHGSYDYWLLKLDSNGNLNWQKTYGGSSSDYTGYAIPAFDGGYYLSGYTYSVDGDITGNHGGGDLWLLKISSTGSVEWKKTIGGENNEFAESICETADHNVIIAGHTQSSNTGDIGTNHGVVGTNDALVVKLVAAPLPVVLNSFNASVKGDDAVCSWNTLQEQNSSHFLIERSNDAIHFIVAGTVAAKGNSMIAQDYSFTDPQALIISKEWLYYRLKMVNLDGSFTYSNTIRIKIKYPLALNIYPNPVAEQLKLSFVSSAAEEVMLVIINNTGSKLYEQAVKIVKGNNSFTLNVATLAGGNYTLLLHGKKSYQARFIKTGK